MRLPLNARLRIFVVRYGRRTTKKSNKRRPLPDGVQHPWETASNTLCRASVLRRTVNRQKKEKTTQGGARRRLATIAPGTCCRGRHRPPPHRRWRRGRCVVGGRIRATLWGKDPAPSRRRIRARFLKEHNPSPPWGACRRGARTAAEGSAPPWSSNHCRLIQELGSTPSRTAMGSVPP
jgi:hypothetical protein